MKTLVMKFGGAAVLNVDRFSLISQIIISRLSIYSRLVIVVSAMGETTNRLIELAKCIHPDPPQREYDMLISVGERISMSLLAMALCRRDYKAVSFTGSQSGIITCSNHADAKIIDVRPKRLEESLNQGKIVIVAGFQGVSETKEITTLGRGGSDTSAVALGIALGASKIEFFKDVPGIYDHDPKRNRLAFQYSHLSYQAALQIADQGAKILHARAIRLAAKNSLPLHVRSFMSSYKNNEGTLICDEGVSRERNPRYEEA